MILSKQVAVHIDIVACKLKKYTASLLRKQGVGLTPEQFLLIDLLWNQGPMTQQQLADAMLKDKNSVTKLIDALERKELVFRKQSLTDRRANVIFLTEKAETMKNDAKEKGISMLDHMIDGISEEELHAFLGTLDKMSKNMSRKPRAKKKKE